MDLLATLMRRRGTLAVIRLQDTDLRMAGAIINRIIVWRKTAAVRIRCRPNVGSASFSRAFSQAFAAECPKLGAAERSVLRRVLLIRIV